MASSGKNMYPRVKVRVQREDEDQYDYEKSSLKSLKAFEWLSLHHMCSSDETPRSVVRIPRMYVPMSPTPSYLASKEETNKTKKAVDEERHKPVRATSAPRPRAVLSSPDNDGLIGSKAQTRRELLSSSKDHKPCQNRHTQCKVYPKSASGDSFGAAQRHKRELADPKNGIRAKGRGAVADSSTRAGHRKKTTTPSGPE